jgi:hypothetical protein
MATGFFVVLSPKRKQANQQINLYRTDAGSSCLLASHSPKVFQNTPNDFTLFVGQA